jgi:K(+)-stimulated pyrophosphate-energized sodium pump
VQGRRNRLDPVSGLWVFPVALAAGLAAVAGAAVFAATVLGRPQGSAALRKVGLRVREGAEAFLWRQYLPLAGFVVLVAAVLALVVDLNVLGHDAFVRGAAPTGIPALPWTALAYLLGAAASSAAGIAGMSICVRASIRTAQAARSGIGLALRVAFGAGTVMGLSVAGVGLTGVTLLWILLRDPALVAGFGFGASSVALFARVGGGIFTKAADVGADLVGKVEEGIPEDDPRNAATIADNVGDLVGDVAGVGADLFESYVGATIAALLLAVVSVAGAASSGDRFDDALIVLPFAVGAAGIVGSLVGVGLVRTRTAASMRSLLWTIRRGVYGAALVAVLLTGAAIVALGLPVELFWVVVVGILVGQAIGLSAELFTSYAYRPTRWIAEQAPGGAGTVVIAGLAVGLLSTAPPALALVGGVLIASELAGLYGVALAAVSMLATVAITLATDAFGSVSDVAGGLAEQADLDPEARRHTDALDALGNTTAATGKGFAIGSAVLTALALMAAYTQVVGVSVLSLTDPRVLSGLVLGAMLAFLFAALAMAAVGRTATLIIAEVRRQFRDIPGLREGRPGVEPDPRRVVDIGTVGALRAMVLPGALAVISPIAVGVLLGAEALGGLLAGSIATGFVTATFMANAGGAWDNAKKHIEAGNLGGSGSAAHAATVIADTVGDPFKDTAGPSLNILIKLMAIVAVLFGPFFA